MILEKLTKQVSTSLLNTKWNGGSFSVDVKEIYQINVEHCSHSSETHNNEVDKEIRKCYAPRPNAIWSIYAKTATATTKKI